ncbi:uncharacterized protein PGTG_10539 [Puccinia graminis f. sp. tritici CRL 75-36-700-3]|uniref:Uncharacterized protein n=1 Tax=Puccinia graminis f. sp. tritici (strain CRL 75-36-700-3 / race SCCL) TaxID=418459 RepID=E3KIN6_PUCGT|nr:uncharacterized protein PGTG_10539 [Puccinia graminis f. sp. tritici CRL 75-36-700-3]EFP84161.2 hypothetical protein PGTG_10539 [Puccinia graminis f. sp. tritici CRL 75-36-700-3]
MQARKTLFSFVLVVSALAGLASAAPSSSPADAAAAAPPAQEKAGSPAAAASAASADKQTAAGQEGASTASQANPQNAAVFAATGAADATTAATTGEDASAKADHKKRNADAAPTGKIPDSADKADSTTQANPQNAAVFSAISPTDASTVSTAGDEAFSNTGHEKRNADAPPAGKIPESADKADSGAQGVPQFNAVDAAANGQATDAAFASTHAVAQTRRSEPSGAAADGKKDATAENTSQPSPKDSQTPQEAQQLNTSPSGSTPDSGAENPASDKKDHWHFLSRAKTGPAVPVSQGRLRGSGFLILWVDAMVGVELSQTQRRKKQKGSVRRVLVMIPRFRSALHLALNSCCRLLLKPGSAYRSYPGALAASAAQVRLSIVERFKWTSGSRRTTRLPIASARHLLHEPHPFPSHLLPD